MIFKESTYPIINGVQKEIYQETGLSQRVKELINECIKNFDENVQDKISGILAELKENDSIHIKRIGKSKICTYVENLYNMKDKDFLLVADEIKDFMFYRNAIDELINNEKIIIKNRYNISKLALSNADVEININYNCKGEGGNRLVYIYDLYFDCVIEVKK